MFKNPSFIFDILCTVVWLVLAVRYARKGFLASVVQLTGSLISLFGARAFSGWAAGQVFQNFFAGSFRDQIAAITVAVVMHADHRRRQAAPETRAFAPGSQLFASRWVAVGRSRRHTPRPRR